MNYYERHLGDYARDAGHLSLVEEGVFSRLLDRYYATEGGIPDDQAVRIARATSKPERDAVKAVLREFFHLVDGVWLNNRAEAEIARYRSKQDKARASAEARWGKSERNAPGMRTHSEGNAPRARSSHQTPDKEPSASTHTGLTATVAGDQVGRFEGHENPVTTPNPVAAFAIALTRAGFGCTSMNPDLVAYVGAGGSVDHLVECAAHPDCAGKKATYPIRMARRELADRAAPVSTGPPRAARAAAPSRHLTGVAGFLGVDPHDLVPSSRMVLEADRAGAGEPLPAEPGRLSRQ